MSKRSWSRTLRCAFLIASVSLGGEVHKGKKTHHLLETTSHFSGVVTITLAWPRSLFVAQVESPVNSTTFHPSAANFWCQSRARSPHRLFVGHMYTALASGSVVKRRSSASSKRALGKRGGQERGAFGKEIGNTQSCRFQSGLTQRHSRHSDRSWYSGTSLHHPLSYEDTLLSVVRRMPRKGRTASREG